MRTAGLAGDQPTSLPIGVEIRPLVLHRDARGAVAEIFREDWNLGVHPVQWTMISSYQRVLRGVHVHPRHDDYVTVLHGRMSLGLRDLRPESPTEGQATLLELNGETPLVVTVPHGVAHGLYFPEPAIFMLGVSAYFDRADELGCHWSDPALEIPWPVTAPILSERDAALPPLSSLRGHIQPWPA